MDPEPRDPPPGNDGTDAAKDPGAVPQNPGIGGPGVTRRRGVDPSLWLAALFVALGWLPVAAYRAVLGGSGYFGPLQLPALMAMVGILAAVIGVLRAVDLKDRTLRNACIVVGGVGWIRLFIVPLAGF